MLRQIEVFLLFLILSIVFYIIGVTKAITAEPNDKFEFTIMTGWFYYLITYYWFRKSFKKKYAREPIVERFGLDIDTMESANTFDKYFVAIIIIIPIILTLLTKLVIDHCK
jgi:Ca2+-dependent lipid-binding protein